VLIVLTVVSLITPNRFLNINNSSTLPSKTKQNESKIGGRGGKE